MEEEQKIETSEGVKRSISPRAWWIAALGAVIVFFSLAGGTWAYVDYYEGRIYPGVAVDGIELSGMTATEASATLQEAFAKMLAQGERIEVEGTVGKIDLHVTSAEDPDLSYDLLSFDADKTAQDAYAMHRQGNKIAAAIGALSTGLLGSEVTPIFSVKPEPLAEAIRAAFPALEQPGADTNFSVTWDKKTPILTVVAGSTGITIDTTDAGAQLILDAQDFTLSGFSLKRTTSQVTVTTEEATALIPDATVAIANAPFTLNYTGEDKKNHTWSVDAETLAEWIRPVKNEEGVVEIGIDETEMTEWLKQVHQTLDIAPQDAKFSMEGNKVTEFKGSQSGVSVDDAATIEAFTDVLGEKNATMTVSVVTVEPSVTTESVNTLGIKEILGVGYSNYGRSPSNRIKNISHGASKLNGMLIAPGETISAIEHLAPFTLEDGYFPELVILGDEIKPEIGGGLCQIGTTLFRAAMNSGLDIVERRNHSLTVSYYNDPSNGKPGTDATLYEPNPDLKFTNTTGNYILLMTDVNQQTGDLYFTMWGTSDGRKAWYDPPVVLSTAPAGADRITETTTLAPGVEKCQSAHSGATTNFTYHIVGADGTEVTKDFPSYYRPLPRICLVGVAETTETPTTEETPTDTTTPEESTEAPAEETTTETETE